MTTGWILPVTTEAYWTVALFAWLVIPAGPRSRKFAMWSAAGVFTASLTGQESGHLVAAAGGAANPFVVGLVTALPLTAVALGAVLISLAASRLGSRRRGGAGAGRGRTSGLLVARGD